jgi:hypothetical protein
LQLTLFLRILTALAQFVISSVGGNPDFVLAVGDDTADEFMFDSLESHSEAVEKEKIFTCTVGKKASAAKFYVDEHNDVIELVSNLADASKEIAAEQQSRSSSNSNDAKDKTRKHPPKVEWEKAIMGSTWVGNERRRSLLGTGRARIVFPNEKPSPEGDNPLRVIPYHWPVKRFSFLIAFLVALYLGRVRIIKWLMSRKK